MYPSPSLQLNKETDTAIYFFTGPFYPLDNFSAHQIEIWKMIFPTAEHAFQWKKFSLSAPLIAEKILTAKSPEQVKNIAIQNRNLCPETWRNERVGVMREILFTKATQHDDVRCILTSTQTKHIIENSPVDVFWGCGPNGDGQNMVGKIWEEVRANLIT